MDWTDERMKIIYERAMINRTQAVQQQTERMRTEMEKNFWAYLHNRLVNLAAMISQCEAQRNASPKAIHDAKIQFENLCNIVYISTIPEVIDQLTMDLQQEFNLIKIKAQK